MNSVRRIGCPCRIGCPHHDLFPSWEAEACPFHPLCSCLSENTAKGRINKMWHVCKRRWVGFLDVMKVAATGREISFCFTGNLEKPSSVSICFTQPLLPRTQKKPPSYNASKHCSLFQSLMFTYCTCRPRRYSPLQ